MGPHAGRVGMTGVTAVNEKSRDVGDITTDAGDMITQYVTLGRRVFAERQFLLRSGDKVRYLSLPGWLQAAVVLMGVVVIGGVGGLAGAYHNLHKAIHRKEAEISDASARTAALVNLRQSLAEADEQYADMSQQFEDMKQQLEAMPTTRTSPCETRSMPPRRGSSRSTRRASRSKTGYTAPSRRSPANPAT